MIFEGLDGAFGGVDSVIVRLVEEPVYILALDVILYGPRGFVIHII